MLEEEWKNVVSEGGFGPQPERKPEGGMTHFDSSSCYAGLLKSQTAMYGSLRALGGDEEWEEEWKENGREVLRAVDSLQTRLTDDQVQELQASCAEEQYENTRTKLFPQLTSVPEHLSSTGDYFGEY